MKPQFQHNVDLTRLSSADIQTSRKEVCLNMIQSYINFSHFNASMTITSIREKTTKLINDLNEKYSLGKEFVMTANNMIKTLEEKVLISNLSFDILKDVSNPQISESVLKDISRDMNITKHDINFFKRIK